MTDFRGSSLTLRGSDELLDEGVDSSRDSVDRQRRQFVTRLFERYRGHLLGYLTELLGRVEDAEDVAQESYARLLAADDLNQSGSNARAYLFRIATNLAYDRFRRRRVRGPRGLTEVEELPSAEPTPEHSASIEQTLDAVKQVILDLKPRCRQVFLLRTARDLSYEDIAARLGVSKRTVEREMQHALERCQRKLGTMRS